MLMKKLLFTLVALLATMTTFAQTNLTSGKTVVPLGGLKNFQPVGVVTVDNLQKITTDGNTGNVFLFPENGANLEANKKLGIQGFYIDLGASKSIGAIQSTWEGADCGANIYVTDTEPAADGSLTGETLIATFTNAQEAKKDAAVAVENSGRYIVFVPTEATNYDWGVKIRTFVALEKQASVLTTLEVSPSMVKVGEATEMTFTAKDQLGLVLTEGVTYTATNATLEGTTLTATAVGDVVITATMGENSATATIKAINVSAPTENPTEPTDLAANVIAVYSAKYNKGINDSNPTWGVGGGAPNPLYTSVEEVEIANDHKVVHVKGTGFNSRTAGGVGVTSDYTKIHVALYPFTATTAKIFGDNAYGKALTVEDLVPGQWNYVEIDNPDNQPNYMLVELVGETEFYLDHFYLAKPAADDSEAPTLETAELVSAGIGCATLKLKATDDKSAQVTYVINDGTKDYTTKGDSGTEITYTIGGLAFGQAYTFSIVAQDDNENKSAAQQVGVTTLALAAAPVPTQAAADVISIYSNVYTGTGYAYGGWGQSTVVADEQVDNDDMLKLTNYNYLGFEFTTQLDLSEMEYLHIDVLPLQDMSLGITPFMAAAPTENSTSVGTLVPGQWNSCDIKLSDLRLDYANFKAFQLKLDKGTGTDVVYIDNIYFWKSAGGEVPTPEITTITVAAEATSIEAGATTQLTVKDQDDNAVAADQVTFSSSDETVAIVNENGVVTGVAEGSATITATLKSDNNISSTVEITVTAATPVEHEGTQYTSGDHNIWVRGNHYVDTNTYELIIESDEEMNGLGGSFWNVNGVGTDMRTNLKLSTDKKTMTVTCVSTSAPNIYTPLYVMMPGEVNFGNITVEWNEIGGTDPVEEPTSGEASATITSTVEAVNGKTLNYTWAFTQTGADVTVTFECTNKSDIDGIVDGFVIADGVEIQGEGGASTLTYTWIGCTEGQVVKAKHKWMFAGGDFMTPEYSYTVKAIEPVETLPTIPTEPTANAENVLAVYSATYGKAELTTTNPGWGGYKDATGNDLYDSFEYLELTEGENTHKVVHVTGTGINSRTAGDVAASGYTKLYAAIWPTTATSGVAFQDNGYNDRIALGELVPGQWNYVELPVKFTNNYITIALDGETEFYIDHIYYTKPGADVLVISEPDDRGIVNLTGGLNVDNMNELASLDAPIIDITGLTIDEAMTAITTANPNVLIIVPGTVVENVATSEIANKLTGNKNFLVKNEQGYLFPISQLEIVDDGQSPVWTGFFVSTNTVGYAYSRTIHAGEYTTAYLPAASTAVEGLKVYTFKSYENSQIELVEKTDGVVPANTPVVLYNATDADLTITAEGTGDLNFGGTPATVEQGGATFTGNYKVEEAENLFTIGAAASAAPARHAQSGSTLTVKAVEGKTVPFRAYFKGVTEGEDISTAIDGLRVSRTLNGKAYTLDGREAKGTLQKGIYIIDGKKVVIK